MELLQQYTKSQLPHLNNGIVTAVHEISTASSKQWNVTAVHEISTAHLMKCSI